MSYPLWAGELAARDLLGAAASEVGVQFLTIPAVSGPLDSILFDADDRPHPVRIDDGWHYPPEQTHYARGSLRPKAAHWFGRRNLLEPILETAARHTLAVRFAIDLRGVRRLMDGGEHLVMRSAGGEPLPDAGPCVCQPALRELLHATIDDLARFSPAAIRLQHWALDTATGASSRPLGWHTRARQLLDTCFCDACRQIAVAAGIDPDFAARSVTVRLQKLLGRAGPATPSRAPAEDPVLDSYVRVRAEDVSRWLEALTKTHAAPAWETQLAGAADAAAVPPGWRPAIALLSGSAGASLDPADTDPDASAGGPENPATASRGGALAAARAGAALLVPAWRPTFGDGAALVRATHELAAAGAASIEYTDLATSPREAIDWCKQAVRYARRALAAT